PLRTEKTAYIFPLGSEPIKDPSSPDAFVSTTDFDGNRVLHGPGRPRHRLHNRRQKEIASQDSGNIQKQRCGFRRREGGSRYQKTVNPGNTNRVRIPDVRKSENPRSSPLRLHRGSRSSKKLLADLGFGRFPVFKPGCPIGDSLSALIKNLSMPFRGFNRFWRSRQVLPESFHSSEFFLNRHFMKRKFCRHDQSIPRSLRYVRFPPRFRYSFRGELWRVCKSKKLPFESILQKPPIRKSISCRESEDSETANPSPST